MADSEKDLVEAENNEEASNEQIRDEVERKIRKETIRTSIFTR